MVHPVRTPSDAVVDEVLAAAGRLLGQGGPESLTIRGIAREAGVAPMSVYNHFESKDGVVDSLTTRGFNRLRDALEDAGRDPDPERALLEAGRRYRRLALEEPATYRLMFQRPIDAALGNLELMEAGLGAFGALVQLIGRVHFAHGVTEPPEVAAQAIWSMVHGFVALELVGKVFTQDPEGSFEQLLNAGLHLAITR